MNTNQNVPFTAIVNAGNHTIAFNAPPESINRWTLDQQTPPNVLVIGDTAVYQKKALCNPEFLLYKQMFVNKGLDFTTMKVVKPLYLVGEKKRVDAQFKALRLAFHGLTKGEMRNSLGLHKILIRQFTDEQGYFAPKRNGLVIPFEEFVKCVYFEDDEARLPNAVVIHHVSKDRYQVCSAMEINIEVKLVPDGVLKPTWDLPTLSGVENSHQFAAYVLGADGGFGMGPTTGYLIEMNSEYTMWDCPPYASHILRKNGIKPGQINSIIITHIHDDHANDLIEFAFNDSRCVEIISTKEIIYMLKAKLVALMNVSIKRLEKLFRWREISVRQGIPVVISGHKFQFHYGVHSIPSFGGTITKQDKHLITFSGDTGFDKVLDGAQEAGAISVERRKTIQDLIKTSILTVVDAGEAMIHGYPDDFMERNHAELHLSHRGSLPEELMGRVNLVAPGMAYAMTEAKGDVFHAPLMAETLHSMKIHDWSRWASEFSLAGSVQRYEPNLTVVNNGSNDIGSFFVILHGLVDVMVGNQVVTTLGKGDFFGEQAIMTGGKRNATIYTRSVCLIQVIPAETFLEMIAEQERIAPRHTQGIVECFQKAWEHRDIISRVRVFQALAPNLKNQLSQEVKRVVDFAPGDRIIRAGSDTSDVFVIVEGSAEVVLNRPGVKDPVLEQYTIIGESVALGWADYRNANVVARESTMVYVFDQMTIRSMYQDVPGFRSSLIKLGEERGVVVH